MAHRRRACAQLARRRNYCPVDWDQARDHVEERLRTICVALPEVHEGPAWNGRSWLIRRNHFCQVFTIDDREAHTGIMIFRSESPTRLDTYFPEA